MLEDLQPLLLKDMQPFFGRLRNHIFRDAGRPATIMFGKPATVFWKTTQPYFFEFVED